VFSMNINSIVSDVGMLMACGLIKPAGKQMQETTRSLARKISQIASGSRGLSIHSAAKTAPVASPSLPPSIVFQSQAGGEDVAPPSSVPPPAVEVSPV
jgi:hypothetical protein